MRQDRNLNSSEGPSRRHLAPSSNKSSGIIGPKSTLSRSRAILNDRIPFYYFGFGYPHLPLWIWTPTIYRFGFGHPPFTALGLDIHIYCFGFGHPPFTALGLVTHLYYFGFGHPPFTALDSRPSGAILNHHRKPSESPELFCRLGEATRAVRASFLLSKRPLCMDPNVDSRARARGTFGELGVRGRAGRARVVCAGRAAGVRGWRARARGARSWRAVRAQARCCARGWTRGRAAVRAAGRVGTLLGARLDARECAVTGALFTREHDLHPK
ncbi:hypothetical protein CRG98_030644 [Punica granatum]|uniref:Uncharacterized protein n=1 Tax=Punica granatum TaxID=22663 RepID=A0A2I0IY95_PUNGR|nr:hypothetical protein CRG98_030644 [Punica granatum]